MSKLNSLVIFFVLLIMLSRPAQDPASLFAETTDSNLQLNANGLENPFTFLDNILLSTEDNPWPHHVEPTMAISDNDSIFVGWKNALEHDSGGRSVSFTYSTNGTHWQDPYDMPSAWFSGSIQSDPWMQFFNGTLYYSYLEHPTGAQGQPQITFTTTNDYGQTWTQAPATNGSGYADKETFAIDENGTIYLVYSDVYDDFTVLWLSRSYDNGLTFVEDVYIMDRLGLDIGAYIVTGDPGELYVAWT
ncbi:MAG: hypothetical protein ACXAD7_25270, partial [Candidatus Kariarchaeaceae archaeon]